MNDDMREHDAPEAVDADTPVDRRPSRLTDLSASRIGTANKCGLAFKYQYVDQIPALYDSAALMFGSVIHNAVEDWYGPGHTTDENINQHRELDLRKLVAERWREVLPPKILDNLDKALELERECEAIASVIMIQRPHLKKPRQTKAFMETKASADFIEAKIALGELAQSMNDVKWPQNETPYTAWEKSMTVADSIVRAWRDQPRPLVVEEPFMIDFEGYTVRGRIDQVRQDIDSNGVLLEPEILDIKSSKQPLTPMEAFIQCYLYYEAVKTMDHLPDTDKVAFFLCRLLDDMGEIKVQRGKIDPERHRKLALRLLHSVVEKINGKHYGPHYGHWCKMCSYKDLCESEINLWEGDGTLGTLEIS